MRKKIYAFFVVIILLLFSSVFFVTPEPSFLFSNAKGDCSGRALFMYHALYKDTLSAEVVFFGSSRTMNGVNDSLISSVSKKRILNLGYCRYGRNLEYFLINEYCKMRRPKKIVLEVREEEGNNSHPMTAFLLPPSQIIEGFSLLDTDVFSNLYNNWLCHLKYIRTRIYNNNMTIPENSTEYGYWRRNLSDNSDDLFEKKKSDSLQATSNSGQSQLNRNSRYYLDKLYYLCQEKNIELYFLYLPSYGNVVKIPAEKEQLGFYGKLLAPPDSLFAKSGYYSDYGHFNYLGANVLSTWLCNELYKQHR